MSDALRGVRFVESTEAAIEAERDAEEARSAESQGANRPMTSRVRSRWLVRFPAGLDDRESFFRWAVVAFRLPGYFGHNWDALEECWRDLSWCEPMDRVVLVLDELPLRLQPVEQRIFFALLRERIGQGSVASSTAWEILVPESLRAEFLRVWRDDEDRPSHAG